MIDDLLPCRKCITFAICNSIVAEVIKEENSYIKVINKLQDRCSIFQDYVCINPISTIVRHLKYLYG